MSDTAKTAKVAVPLTPQDRDRLHDRAERIGLSATAYARMLIKRDLAQQAVA